MRASHGRVEPRVGVRIVRQLLERLARPRIVRHWRSATTPSAKAVSERISSS